MSVWSGRAYCDSPLLSDSAADEEFLALSAPRQIPWIAGARINLIPGESISRAVARTGCYEPETMAVLERVLRPGDTFLDVGANSGLFTVAAAKLVGETGRVIAIEPSARERAKIAANVSASNVSNVRIWGFAVGRRFGLARLAIATDQHAGLNTIGRKVFYKVPIKTTCIVPTAPLDALRLQRLDLIKVDIEGAETDFLLGAKQTIARCKPAIILEISGNVMGAYGASLEAMTEALQSLDYVMHEITDFGEIGPPSVRDDHSDRNVIALSATHRLYP